MKESQNTEFKQSWHDKDLEWICGYATAKGGTLYIGIASLGVGWLRREDDGCGIMLPRKREERNDGRRT